MKYELLPFPADKRYASLADLRANNAKDIDKSRIERDKYNSDFYLRDIVFRR